MQLELVGNFLKVTDPSIERTYYHLHKVGFYKKDDGSYIDIIFDGAVIASPHASEVVDGNGDLLSYDVLSSWIADIVNLPEQVFAGVDAGVNEYSPKYRLYDYVDADSAKDRSKFPGSIIIPQQLALPLYSDEGIIIEGERISETWYSAFSDDTLSDPIVQFLYEFVRAEDGLLQYIIITERCMLDTGEWSEVVKTRRKLYQSTGSKMQEIKRRRENIVTDLKKRATDFNLSGAIGSLFTRYLNEISLYVESGDISLRDAILVNTESSFDWLDTKLPDGTTIRAFLAYNFSIGVNV